MVQDSCASRIIFGTCLKIAVNNALTESKLLGYPNYSALTIVVALNLEGFLIKTFQFFRYNF